jgi:hypothetical protein
VTSGSRHSGQLSTTPAACALFDRIDSPALWLTGSPVPGPVKVAGPAATGSLYPRRPSTEALSIREVLRPRRHERWRNPRRLLQICHLPRHRSRTAAAVLAEDREMVLPVQRQELLALMSDVRAIWPFVEVDDGSRYGIPLIGRSYFPLRYANALGPRHGVVLWLTSHLLEDCTGSSAKAERLGFYRERGVSILKDGDARLPRFDKSVPVPAPPALALMRAHMRTGAAAPFDSLLQEGGVEIVVVDTKLRLFLVASGRDRKGDWVCRSSTATHLSEVGCWRRLPGDRR